jgi:hypothetical protein
VKIYFASPTLDLITKDLKANFMTKISNIGWFLIILMFTSICAFPGGTMGLFAGFSIISGFEIIFFVCKIVLGGLAKRRTGKKRNVT